MRTPRNKRNTTSRDQHRRIIANGLPPSPFGPHPDCYHCHEPIDYEAGHLDPMSFQLDHLVPLDKGGPDTLDNKVPSHRKCNRDKSNKLVYQQGVTFVTDRKWWRDKVPASGGALDDEDGDIE